MAQLEIKVTRSSEVVSLVRKAERLNDLVDVVCVPCLVSDSLFDAFRFLNEFWVVSGMIYKIQLWFCWVNLL